MLNKNKLIVFRDEHRRNFTQISNHVTQDSPLSHGAFRLLVFLLSQSEKYNVSAKVISRKLGRTERMIQSYMDELKKFGHLQVFQIDKAVYVWEVRENPKITIDKAN